MVPPRCLNLEKNTTTCSKKVFDGYNAQILAYNEALKARIEAFNTYTRSLNAFVRAANDYSACQSAKASAQMPPTQANGTLMKSRSVSATLR